MHPRFEELLTECGLQRLGETIRDRALPAVGFSLHPTSTTCPLGASKLGGSPAMTTGFSWPLNRDRPLDFLLQVDLADVQPHNPNGLLPESGLLSFFYDLDDQPWGYDPEDLQGFRVVYDPDPSNLMLHKVPHPDFALTECALSFHATQTLPILGSRAGEALERDVDMTEDEWDGYYEFCDQFERLFKPTEVAGNHHLLGHSANIQGDMQLEAQLVMNGIYCGDATGYEDPRWEILEPGADDWMLLLQLDSDDTIDLMWGDCGMLYFWIRRDDLASRQFDNVWMTMQCS